MDPRNISYQCTQIFSNLTKRFQENNMLACEPKYDLVKCWAPTLAGQYSYQKCPTTFSGTNYNPNENAEKFCQLNGTWRRTNYEPCYNLSQDNSPLFWTYIIGYTISFVSLCTAFGVLMHFKSLRCLRNVIHSNLIVSFIIRVVLWTLMYSFTKSWPQMLNNLIYMLYISSQLANFFWMFVEGLYLLIVIVWTYKIERVKIWHFAIIGWATPALLTIIWVITMVLAGIKNWVRYKNSINLIWNIPIIVILVINLIVLVFLVITLINKLKATSATTVEKENRRNHQFGPLSLEYKKALKSTVILMPLLGFTHIVFILNPPQSRFTLIFKVFNAALSSSQGFWVSLIYCFFNTEVRNTIRHHLCVGSSFYSTQHTGRSRVPNNVAKTGSIINNEENTMDEAEKNDPNQAPSSQRYRNDHFINSNNHNTNQNNKSIFSNLCCYRNYRTSNARYNSSIEFECSSLHSGAVDNITRGNRARVNNTHKLKPQLITTATPAPNFNDNAPFDNTMTV